MAEMYGTQPLTALDTKGSFSLENGMYCVYGKNVEGICVDVYQDKKSVYKPESLVFMQHGIQTFNDETSIDASEFDPDMLYALIDSMSDEFSE